MENIRLSREVTGNQYKEAYDRRAEWLFCRSITILYWRSRYHRLRDILKTQNEFQTVVTVGGNKPIFARNQESQVSLKSNDSS